MKKKSLNVSSDKKAWIVAVNMGYGHQRTAYPLRHLAFSGKIINANDYEDIPVADRNIWESSRRFYEFMSNFQGVSFLGRISFYVFDQFQKIMSFYPKRDLSRPSFVVKQAYRLIKNGWGRHLIETLAKKPVPFVTTFYTPAFMAEYFGYPGEIYCVVADADVARVWAPLEPQKSRIKYFAPTARVVERLKLYGVKIENIFLTGYPLPRENLGSLNFEVAKSDLGHRLKNLDPESKYCRQYSSLIEKYVGVLPKNASHPFTLMFSIGGAGAQKEIGTKIIKNLKERIKNDSLKLILSVGIRRKTQQYFLDEINKHGLGKCLGKGIQILIGDDIADYFKKFNDALRLTDVLWSKPSELSFYCALGIPVIIAPPLGSQEQFNRAWLLKLGAGINQVNLNYAAEWLVDYLGAGWFAEAAMQGFVETEKRGVFNIERILLRE